MTETQEQRHAPEQSAVVERTCRLLHEMARYGGRGARLVDLTRSASLTRPAALRILRTLCVERLAMQDESRRYFLGPAFYEMSRAAPSPMGDLSSIRPIVRQLAKEAGDTAYLSIRQGDHCHYLMREEGAFPIRTHLVEVGNIVPLIRTYGGITILSSMDPDEAAGIVDRQMRDAPPEVRQQRPMIEQALTQARQDGHVSGSELVIRDVSGLGVPILTPDGAPFLAITISAITSRLTGEHLPRALHLLKDAARDIETMVSAFGQRAPAG